MKTTEQYDKVFWDGAGYYAGAQYDEALDGSPMFSYHRMDETDPYRGSIEAHERRLGTISWYDAPPGKVQIV